MGRYHDKRFPGEDDRYREARDRLLQAELDLRGQIETVAAMRRELPLGGAQFPSDYGDQHPVLHVFVRRDDGVHHFWSSELLYEQTDGQPRHIDLTWPLWNLFDLTPEGRGTDWYPRYQK